MAVVMDDKLALMLLAFRVSDYLKSENYTREIKKYLNNLLKKGEKITDFDWFCSVMSEYFETHSRCVLLENIVFRPDLFSDVKDKCLFLESEARSILAIIRSSYVDNDNGDSNKRFDYRFYHFFASRILDWWNMGDESNFWNCGYCYYCMDRPLPVSLLEPKFERDELCYVLLLQHMMNRNKSFSTENKFFD
jgi:hypothetical protein